MPFLLKLGALNLKRVLSFIVAFVSFLPLFAQTVSVEAKLDSIAISIGQQAHLSVSVTSPKGAHVTFPVFKRSQYIVPGVEVLGASDADTTHIDGATTVSKVYTLTSFDENLYALGGINVKVNGKSYKSNSLALKVLTVDVDTLHADKFFPPKDVQDNPFSWAEWSPVFWASFLVLLCCVAMCYLVIRLKQNKPIITHIRIVKRIPPHQKAMKEIDKLRNEHLASSDDQKTYYTQLTDALRRYIKERFGFNAMEMTSAEILYSLQESGDKAMLDELRNLFRTADLVKFAKYSTLLNENDMNLVNAINFIDQTKIEGQPVEERIVPTLSDDEKKVQNSRITIKTLLVVVGVIIIAMSAMIVYNLLMLLE